MILHENHILYALYSRSSILLSQELHNNVFSGKNVAATPTDTDEVQKEELEEKNLEKVEDVEVVLERIRSLVVQVREKEEEGSKWDTRRTKHLMSLIIILLS